MKILEQFEKNEKYWKNISYILVILFFVVEIFSFFSNIFEYNNDGFSWYLLLEVPYHIKNLIIGFSFEMGILLYFFKIITKKTKDIKAANVYLVLGGLISILTFLINCIFYLINRSTLISIDPTYLVTIVLKFGIIQYFLSLKQIKNSKRIALISCGLIALSNIYSLGNIDSTYSYLSNIYSICFYSSELLLALLYLSLIPYFYTTELKDSEKIKFNIKEIKDKKSLKICVSVLVGIYFVLGLSTSPISFSVITYDFLLFSLYILIFTWFYKTNLSIFIAVLELVSIFPLIVFVGRIKYALLIILLIAIICILLKHNFNKNKKINEEIGNDIEEDEPENKNSQEEYDNITKE